VILYKISGNNIVHFVGLSVELKCNGLEYYFIVLNVIPEDGQSRKYVGVLTQIFDVFCMKSRLLVLLSDMMSVICKFSFCNPQKSFYINSVL
jgi:hypothetical protein